MRFSDVRPPIYSLFLSALWGGDLQYDLHPRGGQGTFLHPPPRWHSLVMRIADFVHCNDQDKFCGLCGEEICHTICTPVGEIVRRKHVFPNPPPPKQHSLTMRIADFVHCNYQEKAELELFAVVPVQCNGPRGGPKSGSRNRSLGSILCFSRERTNVQQLTCNIDLSSSFYYLFFSFVLLELKPFVLKGKSPGEKTLKKCEKVRKILKRFCLLVVALY